jgi:flavin-dependent dehydrogenase
MRVTGRTGQVIDARYPAAYCGRALTRRALDSHLLDEALAAGAELDELRVTGALVDRGIVTGVRAVSASGRSLTCRAPLTIAADGRRSTLAFGLGLAFHPRRPRRWAIGGYYEGVANLDSLGEMHVRGTHYIGVAPLPAGLANVCLVLPLDERRRRGLDARELLPRAVAADPLLAPRFARARPATAPIVLGPLAVETTAAGVPGLLLAGDAAGFIDPMTGDGLRFAIEGGELAAAVALDALASQPERAHVALAARRRRAFVAKQAFNRALRRLVDRPFVDAVSQGVRVVPQAIRAVVRIAGDVPLAKPAW